MMSFFGTAAHVGYVLPGLPAMALESALAVLSVGAFAMGLSDIASGLAGRLGDGDDGAGGSAGGDDPFGGDPADEFGGGQFGEDAFDDDLGEDGFDDWEDDDGFDGLDGGGGGSADLEPRLEELEDEVANVSSTVSTVRSENQAINESVEGIEDNIRQLLDIYEMVTRGVNPFVDDVASGGADGSFGLFDDGDDEEFDDLDPEVADADADSFFDDDFGDEDAEAGTTGPFGEVGDPLADDADDSADLIGDEDATDELGGPDDDFDQGAEDGGSGKTFEDLKSEYESGDADWQTDEEPLDAEDADSPAGSADQDSDPEHDDGPATGAPEEDDDSAASGETSGAESAGSTDGGAEREGEDGVDAGGTDSGKPYLEKLPDGYATELLVIEWLSYLQSRSSTSEALRAIRYYETIDWIGSPAAAALKEYLAGLADDTPDASPGDGTSLTIDHHTHSLRYIGRLGGADVEVERLDWPSPTRGETRLERGEQRGIQR